MTNFCIRSTTMQTLRNHHYIGRIPLDHLRVVKVVTFAGYAKKPDPDNNFVDVFITPRGYIYYLDYNPESTRFCYKTICEPRTTFPWIYQLVVSATPADYIKAFKRRYTFVV